MHFDKLQRAARGQWIQVGMVIIHRPRVDEHESQFFPYGIRNFPHVVTTSPVKLCRTFTLPMRALPLRGNVGGTPLSPEVS